MRGLLVVIATIIAICIFGSGISQFMSDSIRMIDSVNAALNEQYPSMLWDKENADNEEEMNEEEKWAGDSVPLFIKQLYPGIAWGVDTLCVTKSNIFYQAYDMYDHTSLLYDNHRILVENPTLVTFTGSSSSKAVFYVGVAGKMLLVDFSNPASVAKLRTLTPDFTRFTKFQRDSIANLFDDASFIRHYMSIDYPKRDNTYAERIQKWLIEQVNGSQTTDEEVPEGNALLIGYEKKNYDKWIYRGDIFDFEAINQFAANRYFHIKKMEYGGDFSSFLYFSYNLRVATINDRFITYQEDMHDHNGGAHPYYTERLISFDFVHNRSIDNDHLFKKGSKDAIVQLMLEAAYADDSFRQREEVETMDDVKRHFIKYEYIDNEWKAVSTIKDIMLPQAGITEDGFVFSYQPYEISCFAAGCFHFVVPFYKVMPYLTERGKWLVKGVLSETSKK